jgi:hypothetical protein
MESGGPAGGPSSHRRQREPDDGDATYPAKRTRANRGPLCSRRTVALQAMVAQMHQTWMGLRKARRLLRDDQHARTLRLRQNNFPCTGTRV